MNPNPLLTVIPRDLDGIIRVTFRLPEHPPTVPRVGYTFATAKEAHVYMDGQVVVIGASESAVACFPASVAPVVTAPLTNKLASA